MQNSTLVAREDAPKRYGNVELYKQIHEDAIMLLESVGMKVTPTTAPKILDALVPGEASKLTYSRSDGKFYLSRADIDDCLERVRQGMDYWPGGFGTGGMAAYLVDESGARSSQLEDMKRLAQIFGRTEEITSLQSSFNLCNKIKKSDIQKHIDMECSFIDVMVEASGGKLVTPTLRTDQGIRYIAEYLEKGHKVGAALSITSTFMTVADQMVDIFLLVSKLGVPHIMNSMPIAGLTGPYSMSAIASLAHAECLFGLVLGQLINPGVKVIHGAMPTIADVGKKDMPLRFGSRSNTLLNILIAEVNGHLGLPSCQSACSHSRDSFDEEAEKESAQTYSIVNRFYFHVMRHMFGFSAQLNDFSIDNMEKQIELYRKVSKNPVEVDDLESAQYDPEGLEVLFDGIERNDFRSLNHTLKNVGRSFKA